MIILKSIMIAKAIATGAFVGVGICIMVWGIIYLATRK